MKTFTPPPIIQRIHEAYMRGRYGDIVHTIAQPIAKTLDRHLGTQLADCTSCAKRRRQWNGESTDTTTPSP